jgi:hypothetical protein
MPTENLTLALPLIATIDADVFGALSDLRPHRKSLKVNFSPITP